MAPVRVIFDLYGTLVASLDAAPAPAAAPPAAPAPTEPVPDGRSCPETWRGVAERLLRVNGATFEAEFARTTQARERGRMTFLEALAVASQAARGSRAPADLRAMESSCVAGLRMHLDTCIRPGALRVITRLRELGHEVWICSNASSDTEAALSGSALARALSGTVISSTVGCAKPEPGIYTAASGGGPAVFVGDGGSSELLGARDAGLLPVQVPRYRGDRTVGFDTDWDGLRVAAIEDVIEIVRHDRAHAH